MAKKNKKVEKETRRLMEGISAMIKKKGDGYKFKTKNKKKIKVIKKTCVHWKIDKNGHEVPAVEQSKTRPGYWKCKICNAEFPIIPVKEEQYDQACDIILEYVNQMQFWSVKLGGDADDTKMFLQLKKTIPRFKKVAHNIRKNVDRREKLENKRDKADTLSQFDAYGSYSYRG